MLDILSISGALIGGLGLFILAIGMMTDGLKLAAGSSLRSLLSNWTSSVLKGIFSGMMMTAIVQSSSAVTVASIGFVNAGLLNMRNALGIVYGANIGTTMTGWLVAFAGFKFDIHSIALPMIGVGMFIKLLKGQGRAASFGFALVGFGLFFIGVDVLQNAFSGLVHYFDLSKVTTDGVGGVLFFAFIGIVMTILTQSSSASIALAITAASTGMVDLYGGASMVIGANIGTTSTALFASIGATSNAKRVALAQVIFNAATAVVAFIMLPILIGSIRVMSEALNLDANISVTLAIFHSAFNVLGVLLIFPFNSKLVVFLESRFLTWEEQASHSRYLDKTIAITPDLALNALLLEMKSIGEKIEDLCKTSILQKKYDRKTFSQQASVIKQLLDHASKFIVSVERSGLSEESKQDLANFMRIQQYFLVCTQSSQRVSNDFELDEIYTEPTLKHLHEGYIEHAARFLNMGSMNQIDSVATLFSEIMLLQKEHDDYKAALLLAGTKRKISIETMSSTLEYLGLINHLMQQWAKALKAFSLLHASLNDNNKLVDNIISNQGV